MEDFGHLKGVDIDKCPTCKAPFVPALDCTIFSGPRKGEWDEHTFKPSCNHFDQNFRMSVG